jgi:hypothetical protein
MRSASASCRKSGVTDDNSESSVIAALIAETETAIVAADEDAKLEQGKAFDPLASPDPKAAGAVEGLRRASDPPAAARAGGRHRK